MDYRSIKFDCKYFKGDVPCLPNKLKGKTCDSCDEYNPVSEKIIIIKLGALGDVIRSTPLAYRFKTMYPNCHITWLTLSAGILKSKFIDRVCEFDFRSVYTILNEEYDIALNLDKDKECCVLLNQIKSKKKYGFVWSDGHIDGLNDAAKRKLLTGVFDNFSKQNKKSYLEEIFEICDLKFNREPYLLEVDENLKRKWEKIRVLAEGKMVIGLNTGCGKRWITRLWPEKYWLALTEKILKSSYYPVLLGGPDEHSKNMLISQKTGAFYPGIFALDEFISIVENCDLVVTSVSMAMHIAIGLKKRLVLFNNIFNKFEFDLYGNGKILEPPTGCDCYYGSYCNRERPCMEDVKPDTVFASIDEQLKWTREG